MKIIIDDDTMTARAYTTAEDGRAVITQVEIFKDDTVEELISRATDKLSESYLDMCSPLM